MVKYKPTHEIAYYIPEDKEVDVYYVLKRREEGTPNKDSDLWSSRAQYKSGVGFRLRANKCTGKESYFSAWPGTYNTPEFREMVRRAGMSTKITSRKYRVYHLRHDILFHLNHDDGFKEAFSASEAHFLPDWGRRTSADIEIIHTDDFRREKTLFSMTDQYRVREIDTDERLFTLDIKSWKDVECQNFDKFGKTLTVRWWENFEQGEIQKEKRLREDTDREWKAYESALEEAEKIGISIEESIAVKEREKASHVAANHYKKRRNVLINTAYLSSRINEMLKFVADHSDDGGFKFRANVSMIDSRELSRLLGFCDTIQWIQERFASTFLSDLVDEYLTSPLHSDYDLAEVKFLSSILDLHLFSQ